MAISRRGQLLRPCPEESSARAQVESEVRLIEAVMQAWSQCDPDGQILLLDQVLDNLDGIANLIPRRADYPKSQLLRDFFQDDSHVDGACRSFVQRLNAEGGEVHFLYFWRAFSEVARIVEFCESREDLPDHRAGLIRDPTQASASDEESLAAELELLRDKALSLLRVRLTKKEWVQEMSGAAPFSRQTVAMSALLDCLQTVAKKSIANEFWQVAQASLCDFKGSADIDLEQLTKIMMVWLDSAVTGQWDVGTDTPISHSACSLRAISRRPQSYEGLSSLAASKEDQLSLRKHVEFPPAPSSAAYPHGRPVHLSIYDAFADSGIGFLNALLAPEDSNWKFGGAFHAGVEVNGMEWSYGYCEPGETGVAWNIPKNHHQHRFRQTTFIGVTHLSQDLITDVLTDLIDDYQGQQYHMFNKNCCHFADDFCKRLGVGSIPAWVHRLANFGSHAQGVVKGLTSGYCSCTNMTLAERDEDYNKARWLYRL